LHTNAFRVNCKTGMRAGAARINLREACSAPGAVRAQALAAAGCSGFVQICRRAAKPPRASRTRLRACVGGERHARAQCKTGHRRWRGEPCAAHPSSVARVAAACARGQAPRTAVPNRALAAEKVRAGARSAVAACGAHPAAHASAATARTRPWRLASAVECGCPPSDRRTRPGPRASSAGLRCAAHGRAAPGAVPRHDAHGADVGTTALGRRAVSMANTPARRHGRPPPAPVAGRARALSPLEHCDGGRGAKARCSSSAQSPGAGQHFCGSLKCVRGRFAHVQIVLPGGP